MKKPAKPAIYDPAKIEPKWQKKWASSKIYKSKEAGGKIHDSRIVNRESKFYVLDMFPYPSGEGLHVGHPKGYIATDVISRMKRMQGKSVLHPMGFDAFGLPAENYAIKTKTNPEVAVKKNVARYKEQLEMLGLDYDWSREVNTTDPNYYRWTQWIFLQLYKKGLAFESNEPVNWCPTDKTVLANEDVEDGRCERCGTPVEKKPLRQWVLKITEYADRLLKDLDATDYVMPVVVDKVNPHQPGKPLVKRNVAHAIVYDPKANKYLIIRNKKFNWDTVVIGGVEDGEDAVEAARREVKEETGYTDLEFKRILGGQTEAHYYTKHKDQNRIAYATGVYFELKSDARVAIGADEDKENEILWINENDFVPGKMVNSELPIWLSRLNAEVTIDSNTGIAHFKDTSPLSHVQPDKPFVERNAIAAVVKHWKEDKYMALQWKKVGWRTLITGGPDGSESAEEGARREIIEETGFQNPKLVRKLGHVDATFYHNPKGVNRVGHFDVFYFELKDGERRDLTAEESANHEIVWLTKEEMEAFLTPSAQKYIWHTLFLKKKDSHFMPAKPLLDWPNSIKELQRNWIGKSEGAEIDFRLTMKSNKTKFVILHGYTGRNDKNFVPWLKGELEKYGHEVQAPLLPNTDSPREDEQVPYVLKNCMLDENTVIIGHSLGGVVAMKALMQLNKPVGGLVLVAPALDPGKRKDGYKKNYHKTFAWDYDFEQIKKLTSGKIAVLSDLQEDFRTDYLKFLAEKLSARLVETTATKEHFTANIEPEVLKAVTPLLPVFTTRPDTLFGVTYVVLAPEHPWIQVFLPHIENKSEVEAYITKAACETEIERTDATKEKTGVELKGIKAVNPVNGEEVPVWIADYVLADYGTGAVMAVPAHDERDFAFAKKFNLPIRQVIEDGSSDKPFVEYGKLINSDKFNGLDSESAKKKIIEFAGGRIVTKFKLRDWVFSRQRYWGEPIPLIHCPDCGVVPVPEKQLPVKLPKVKSYEPTGTGESPLANIPSWVNVKCPQCKGKARRETNTMPQWAGSCWYYLRYMDPKNKKAFVSAKNEKYWAPVDLYVGGAEHATRHLIYARFWHKVLFDLGYVSTSEPFTKLQSVGLIMGEDGRKMSKRYGNVVNPDDVVKTFGADSLRIYEMFMGPFDQQISWSTDSIVGMRRFIERIWKLASRVIPAKAGIQDSTTESQTINKTIKKVTEDIEQLHFNTAVSTLMIAVNELEKLESISQSSYESLLKLVAPFAPHVAEELWMNLGNKKSIHISEWPKFDPKLAADSEVKIIVQISGKVRGFFMANPGAGKDELLKLAKELPEAKKWLEGKEIKKEIVVPGRLVNLVV